MKKKSYFEERALYNVVTVYRERGNYLQRLELFEKAIQAYNEALRWNDSDVRSLLGRSLARAKATHYVGALADAARAAELEPENLTALQIRAHTEYEKCAFERALVLGHRGKRLRKLPSDFADCARCAEQTVRECTGKNASKVLSPKIKGLKQIHMKRESNETNQALPVPKHRVCWQPAPAHQVQEMSRIEKQKSDIISRLMSSKYLERMAHDKYFLMALCKDERLMSVNKRGAEKLQELANQALHDLEKRQSVLRERRPLYAARATEVAARARLMAKRKEQLTRSQRQHSKDAKRLLKAAEAMLEKRDTAKCLELAEFAMEQIAKKPANLLPAKEKYLQDLHDIIANAFLDQKRVRSQISESDREKRAFVLLGIALSREPSRDSILRVKPTAPPRDAQRRQNALERALVQGARASERCYVLHELARLLVDCKQALKARYYASKCQTEARASDQPAWLLNATFLLARCHVQQNNRPEARATLLEGVSLARMYQYDDVAEFFDTCVNVSTEGDVTIGEQAIEKRERAMIDLMQDNDLKSEAQHLFKKMSVIPAARRFSVMPGARNEDFQIAPKTLNRRVSIIPKTQQPTRIGFKNKRPLGLQDFDL